MARLYGRAGMMPEITTRKDAKAAGLTRYFTGVACKHGHVAYRSVCDYACLGCANAKAKRRREKYPEKMKAYQATQKRKYHADPNVRRRAVERASGWVAENREAVRQYQKAHYETNREQRLAYSKERLAEKRQDPAWLEKERLRKREQHKKNPEIKRCGVRKRRAMIRGAEGRHNAKDIAKLLEAQKHKCVYCPTDLREHGYEVDHIVALSRGGSNWPSNLQILCKPCNRSKWCKDPLDFAKEKGRLL